MDDDWYDVTGAMFELRAELLGDLEQKRRPDPREALRRLQRIEAAIEAIRRADVARAQRVV